jgi:hypothetical protein
MVRLSKQDEGQNASLLVNVLAENFLIQGPREVGDLERVGPGCSGIREKSVGSRPEFSPIPLQPSAKRSHAW